MHILSFSVQVQTLLQSVSLTTFGDIHVAYIGPGNSSEETIVVLTLQVEESFSGDSFQRLETASSMGNFVLAGLQTNPVWSGGPVLRAGSKHLDNYNYTRAVDCGLWHAMRCYNVMHMESTSFVTCYCIRVFCDSVGVLSVYLAL